ncbi:MAG TPA: 4Fe-4S dicluster domain-containing protein [Spirochaetota bacterium]|nr:4Fe-4S dicluster domain-containing protein [Spirochaetota bacterium]
MKTGIRWRWSELFVLVAGLLVGAFLFYYSGISLAEHETRAVTFLFGLFLLWSVGLFIFIKSKRKGRFEGTKAQRILAAVPVCCGLFAALLLLPTASKPVVDDPKEQKARHARYDARKQPGGGFFVKPIQDKAGDVLTLTIYDICVGRISHRIHRDGPVNPKRVEVIDPAVLTQQIKDDARSLGAHVVGIAKLNPDYVFSHDNYGKPVNISHKFAIVIGVGMNYRLASPSAPLPYEDYYSALPEDIAAELSGIMKKSSLKVPEHVVREVRETMEFFSEGGSAAVQLAQYIRKLGYPARAHLHNRAGEVQIIPIAIDAGLGQMGKNGMLINKKIGPRGSFCVVTTDLPLVPDVPVDMGIIEFCSACNKCAISCPVQAIPYGEPTSVNGVLKWPLDGEKCFEFLVSNPKCMACMGSCPYNKQDYFVHRAATWLIARRSAVSNRLLIWLDDILGYGKSSMVYMKSDEHTKRPDSDSAQALGR